MKYSTFDSPVGQLLLAGDNALAGIYLPHHKRGWMPGPTDEWDEEPFAAARTQLAEYFAGTRKEFDLPLAPRGTAFQQSVWRELRAIPYGQTTTYGALAAAIGAVPGAARAIGAAVGRNPISIIVPCHRVVGAGGAMTGYAGGLAAKEWLLKHERASRRPGTSGTKARPC